MYKQIVVGFDGSERAMRAVKEAGDVATAFGARVHVVTTVKKNDMHDFGFGSDQRVMSDVEIAKDQLANAVRSLNHLDVTTAVVTGPVAAGLVSEAVSVDADVIVVGNKNVQTIGRVFGNIAEDVAQIAPCAVLIAKTA